MKQYEAVIATIDRLGGLATLGLLYQEVFKIDDCQWDSKTPCASIRRIVQENKNIYKIKPGLYALEAYRDKLQANGIVEEKSKIINEEFNHSYYQGLLVEIGNMQKMGTYIPAQDKNKIFLNKKLGDTTTVKEMPLFTYPELLKRAKTIDVIWFNQRKMLSSVYEVEHSTDFQNSLLKYVDLQDFYSEFYIVAALERKEEFVHKMNFSAFSVIKDRIKFIDYEYVSKKHTKLSELFLLEKNNVCLKRP